MNLMDNVTEIIDEVLRAEDLHPQWPGDPIHAAGIVGEEAGELVRAANRFHYEGKPLDEMRKEAVQTAATCIRFLQGINNYERNKNHA